MEKKKKKVGASLKERKQSKWLEERAKRTLHLVTITEVTDQTAAFEDLYLKEKVPLRRKSKNQSSTTNETVIYTFYNKLNNLLCMDNKITYIKW